VRLRVLVSAGEASGDLYASALVSALGRSHPEIEFFGCAGPRMRRAGVRAVVDAEMLSVVGLVEVVSHIPRIHREFRRLVRAALDERPDLAILTDSPDFNLRVARKLHAAGIPIVYLVAPQVWAWREGRLKTLRETVRHLLCIFPFEEAYFRKNGVPATYIGHPLASMIRPSTSRTEFFARYGIPHGRPLVAVLPGSRRGEAARHLDPLAGAVDRIARRRTCTFAAGTPAGFSKQGGDSSFWERFRTSSINIMEGATWDLLAHSDLALAASGTVTVEAALLGTPMVTCYRVTPLSWVLGRSFVRVPYFSMVNLVAGREIVPELIQKDMTAERIAAEAIRLLEDETARSRMRDGLAEVRARLSSAKDPMENAVEVIETVFEKETVNVR
jgi:lipid-A-disaccharide synthase